MICFALHLQDICRIRQSSNRRRQSSRTNRRGLTLVEVMIAIAITLVLLGVLIRLFTYASGEITKGRAIMELSGQLRMTSDQLRNDLSGLTCPTRPWTQSGDGLGYFEYFEGLPHRDNPTLNDTTIGDIDDVIMFTARSSGRPFRGRYWPPGAQPTMIESDLAEIIWYTVPDDRNGNGVLDTGEQLVLRRRVLLIRPDLNDAVSRSMQPVSNDFLTFYERNDISVRATLNGLAANSLADLSQRENRFAHFTGFAPPNFPVTVLPADNQMAIDAKILAWQTRLQNTFPYPIDRAWLNALILSGNYQGEDVILSSLIGFDVKVFDPLAPMYDDRNTSGLLVGGIPLHPTDPGYFNELTVDFTSAPAGLNRMVGRGAYVDLGYENIYVFPAPANVPGFPLATIPGFARGTIGSHFSGSPQPRSRLLQLTYSTWPTSYESDGINQDRFALNPIPAPLDELYAPFPGEDVFPPIVTDQGSDGIDTDVANGTDDAGERETSPPYPFPLRGIQVGIRVVEPDTQQIRQTTVVHNFIPE